MLFRALFVAAAITAAALVQPTRRTRRRTTRTATPRLGNPDRALRWTHRLTGLGDRGIALTELTEATRAFGKSEQQEIR